MCTDDTVMHRILKYNICYGMVQKASYANGFFGQIIKAKENGCTHQVHTIKSMMRW
jgi:hypothetical protein